MRTPLTWYGGKQMLASRIVTMMPPHRVYLEGFCGGASSLSVAPEHVWLSPSAQVPQSTLFDHLAYEAST